MKRTLMFVVSVILFSPLIFGATINFNRVTTYSDGTDIPGNLVPTIQYQGYHGSYPTGPWIPGNVVIDNLPISAPEPAEGTLWYTVDATLECQTGDKAVPVSKTAPTKPPDKSTGCS